MSFPLYILGAGVVATGRIVPALLEFSVWGMGRLMYGVYWVAWGRNEPDRQMERIRAVIREELRLQQEQEQEHEQEQEQEQKHEQEQQENKGVPSDETYAEVAA